MGLLYSVWWKLHDHGFNHFWDIAQRPLNVIDFGANGKRVYTFLLVINSNFSPILHRFERYGGLNVRKSPILRTPPSFNAPVLREPLSRDETCSRKTRGMGLPYGILTSTVFVWSTRATDRQLDRRTDGRAIAYRSYMLSRIKTKLKRL